MEDDDLIPISALQHMLYCERQCALIHVEGLWSENRHTAEGRVLHERHDDPGASSRHGLRVARALPLVSLRHGLIGRADRVEFREGEPPRPVETKRGRPKSIDADRVQLCAQALCLEEMLGVEVPEGDLFYGQTRRREVVAMSGALREKTLALLERCRTMIREGVTPPAQYEPRKCDRCSLLHLCQPKASRSVKRAFAASLTHALKQCSYAE